MASCFLMYAAKVNGHICEELFLSCVVWLVVKVVRMTLSHLLRYDVFQAHVLRNMV